MNKLKFTVKEREDGLSMKGYLSSLGLSATLIKAVKYGGILQNGVQVTVRAAVRSGDTVEIVLPDEVSESIEPMNIPLRVLYEDEYILAVDKPRNMPTHPSRGNSLPTVANAVMGMYGGEFVFRAITRLDRDTSGIVLIAKDRISAYQLSEDMKAGRITKRYRALVCGTPKEAHGVIDAPIRREAHDSIKRGVFPDGKRAVTEYEVIGHEGENSIVDILLHTGRTHQIRVHMAHISHPLVGDFLYGERRDEGYDLRCHELKFPHPKTKEEIVIKA